MDQIKTGRIIRQLRTQRGLTQKQLAERINVSDKAVSKWECGKGCPDVSLLTALADAFGTDVQVLLTGELEKNESEKGNMKKIRFYVCSECQNIITAAADASVTCCGNRLSALVPRDAEEGERLKAEDIGGEWYITSAHEMTKEHYISFMAAASTDDMQIRKLYPEGSAEARFKIRGVRRIFFYCNRDGLFSIDPVKGIDDRESGYDDSQERRELEKTAKKLFG